MAHRRSPFRGEEQGEEGAGPVVFSVSDLHASQAFQDREQETQSDDHHRLENLTVTQSTY